MTKPLLMVVDDETEMVNLVADVGMTCGFEVLQYLNARAFQEALITNTPTVIVMDIVMPEMEGTELLKWLAEQGCTAPIIIMSGYDGKYITFTEHLGSVTGRHILGTLTKPFKIDDLEALLKKSLV
jgi:FixJ family two-component response regulator